MSIKNMQDLIKHAKEVQKNAYAPYSNFNVGAALLLQNEQIITGCNVENASYGATICAERSAVLQAIAKGEQQFQAIAIYTNSKTHTPPCGLCCQVLAEFNPDLTIIMANPHQEPKIVSLKDIFLDPFSKESLSIS